MKMKINKFNYPLFIIMGFIMLAIACKKDDNSNPASTVQLPVITTTAISNLIQYNATSGGNITSDGGSAITARGVCWSTDTMPTINSKKTSNGDGSGSFKSIIFDLTPNTTYYARAYATNSKGTAYGNKISLTTPASSTTIALGQVRDGGYIFYIDGTGQHGLIATTIDQGFVNWGCEGSSISGTSTGIGTGLANTIAIVNQCNNLSSAANVCYSLVLNGKSDWYLPSKDELLLLYQRLYLNNIGNLQMHRYWSSSQYNAQFAWCQLFGLSIDQLYYDKDLIEYPIRAIRSF